MKRWKGFTLIETIIIILVLGVVAVASAPLIYQAAKGSAKVYDISEASGQMRIALDRMVREIRMIRSTSDFSISGGGSGISFTDVDGNDIDYDYSGGSDEISRNSQVILSNVTDITFSRQDANGEDTNQAADTRYITIDLTTANGTYETKTITITISVFLRNAV